MIDKGFNFVTIGADQRAMSAGAKVIVEKMKGSRILKLHLTLLKRSVVPEESEQINTETT